jgi:hypothetical protein
MMYQFLRTFLNLYYYPSKSYLVCIAGSIIFAYRHRLMPKVSYTSSYVEAKKCMTIFKTDRFDISSACLCIRIAFFLKSM